MTSKFSILGIMAGR